MGFEIIVTTDRNGDTLWHKRGSSDQLDGTPFNIKFVHEVTYNGKVVAGHALWVRKVDGRVVVNVTATKWGPWGAHIDPELSVQFLREEAKAPDDVVEAALWQMAIVRSEHRAWAPLHLDN